MSNSLLQGKKGIIFGALDDKSIAWKVAEICKEEGADIILTNAPVTKRFGTLNALSEKINAPIIYADATSMEDLDQLINQSTDIFGSKIDFVLHSIGMSVNVRKKKDYTDLNHEWMKKTFDVSAISFHKLAKQPIIMAWYRHIHRHIVFNSTGVGTSYNSNYNA